MSKEADFAATIGGTGKGGSGGEQVKECPFFYVKSVNEERREITVLASTAAVDRDGEIILPSAFKKRLPTYQANPVVLACHHHRLANGDSPVVGSCVKIWVDKQGLWAIIRFAPTELGEQYWMLYRDKHQRAVSIGFIPHAWEFEGDGDTQRRRYTDVELLEISCVPVPSNREALSRAAQKKRDFVEAKRAGRAAEAAEEEDAGEVEFREWEKAFERWCDSPEGQKYWDESTAAFVGDDDELERMASGQRGFPDFEEWLQKRAGEDGDNDYEKAVRGKESPCTAMLCDAGAVEDTGSGEMEFAALVSGVS